MKQGLKEVFDCNRRAIQKYQRLGFAFPFLFPKRRREVKAELEKVLQERWKVVAQKLMVEGVSKPQIRFWLPGSMPFYLNGKVFLSYSIIFKNPPNATTTFLIQRRIYHSLNSFFNLFF
jgi:hypothetical protein